jgi:hypothetical protein
MADIVKGYIHIYTIFKRNQLRALAAILRQWHIAEYILDPLSSDAIFMPYKSGINHVTVPNDAICSSGI